MIPNEISAKIRLFELAVHIGTPSKMFRTSQVYLAIVVEVKNQSSFALEGVRNDRFET